MEVRCERCRAQYVFSDDQVGEQGLTVRCSNCGHLFKVKKKALVVTLPVNDEAGAAGAVSAADAQRAAAVQAAAQAVKAESERSGWTLRQPSGQTYAFRDMTTLHRWIVERKAHREDEIARGTEPWRRLGAISELQSFFAVVEAAERASRTPPAQPTAVQFPAAVFPGPGTPPPPSRTDQAFPPPPPAPRTEIAFPAQKAPAAPRTEVAFPAQPRTEVDFPAQKVPATPRTEVDFPAQKVPATPRTEVDFPAQKAPATPRTELAFPAQRAPPPQRTDAAFPTQQAPSPHTALDFPAFQPPTAAPATTEAGLPPPPSPAESPLAGLFTPEPMVPPRDDPFANAAPAGDTRPDLGYPATVEGLPPAPAPAAAPLRATAAWEGESPVVSSKPAPEPAWTSADQQTGGTFIDKQPLRPAQKGRSFGPALAVAAIVIAVVGGAGWWFVLRDLPRPPPPAAAAPAPAAPAPAAPAPAPAPAVEHKPVEAAPATPPPAPAPAPEQKPVETTPAPAPAAPVAEQKPVEVAPPPAAPPAEKAPEPKPAAAVAAPPAEKAPARKAEPAGAKALVTQAKRALDKGNAKQALDLYGKAVALEPKNVAALAGRGWSYLELSQYAPAEASFQSALDADAENPSALLGLAETYRYEGRRADAVKYYERYLAASPDGEDAVAAQNAIKSLKE
ncbi:MAG: zinc-ribbon domain-containing protein [Deltaproteobacteria bacterium]|nr:zinc-ribbon domain-containing protein [Deltaproteobacteria bacterium]